MRDRRQVQMTIFGLEEGKPVQQEAQQKDQQCSFKDLPQYSAITHGGELPPGKAHGIADSKEKGWKYQVGRRTAVPMGMPQRRKGKYLAAGSIHDDHKANSHTPEHIKRYRPVVLYGNHKYNEYTKIMVSLPLIFLGTGC